MTADLIYRRRWWTLGVLCLSLLVIGLDNTILNVAHPEPARRPLGDLERHLQWILDTYTLVFAGLLLTAGAIGDRFGRKRALQLGLARVRARIAARRLRPLRRRADRQPRAHGRRRRLHHAVDPLDPHQRLPARASAPRPSASGPACPGSASRSARWPAGSCSSTSGGARCSWSTSPSSPSRSSLGSCSCRSRATRSSRRLDPLGAVLSIAGLIDARLGHHRGARRPGWTDRLVLAGFGDRARRARRRSRRGSCRPPTRCSTSACSGTAASARQRLDRAGVLRAVRRDLLADPVPPVRARLLAVRGRRADRPASRRRDRRPAVAPGHARVGTKRGRRRPDRRRDGRSAVRHPRRGARATA